MVEILESWKFFRFDYALWNLEDCRLDEINWNLVRAEFGISWQKTKYQPPNDILRITTVKANLWYPRDRNEIWLDFEAGVRHKPNLAKNTCFKWISQAVLYDGRLKSNTDDPAPKSILKSKCRSAQIIFRKLYSGLSWLGSRFLLISQIWARLDYHLHIFNLRQFVIFYDIDRFWDGWFSADYLNLSIIGR